MQQNTPASFYHHCSPSNSRARMHQNQNGTYNSRQQHNFDHPNSAGTNGRQLFREQRHPQQQHEFQHDLCLINQLVVGQQQQHQQGAATKKLFKADQHQLQMNNGAQQRTPSAASSLSSNGTGTEEAELDMGDNMGHRTSPGATSLINNLLGRNGINGCSSSSHLHQQHNTIVNGSRAGGGGGVITAQQHIVQQQHHQTTAAGLNGTLLQGIDFAANVSQLANYAGHFSDQLDMSHLFGTAASTVSPFAATYHNNHPQQPQQQQSRPNPVSNNSSSTSSAATTTNGTTPSGNPNRRHRSSAGSNQLKCPFCPKKVAGGHAALQAHLEDCRLVRVHECAQCGKRFKARGGLQQHNKIHINDRPYHCHYCPKQFTQKSHVDQHERIHTGLKPFICQYCGRQFRQRSQQLGHEATHLNRERHASAAMLGGLVGAAGGYDGMAQRIVAQQQRQEITHQNSISPEQQQQTSHNSPVELVNRNGTATNGNGGNGSNRDNGQVHHLQRGQLLHEDNMAMVAQQRQQEMMTASSSFNGLLRAVQSTDTAAVDGLLGLRGSTSAMMKQQQQQHNHQLTGMELNEQLQLAVSAQLMNGR